MEGYFLTIIGKITLSIVSSLDLDFFSNKVVSSTSIRVCLCFSFVFSCFYHRPFAACFVTDLLRRVVVLSTVSFFVGSRVGSSNDKV